MRHKYLPISVILAAALTLCAPALSGQDSTVLVDGPSAGPTVDTIPPGSIQLETGLGFDLTRQSATTDLPEPLLRLGLTSHLEVRYGAANLVEQHSHGGFASPETADSLAGIKFALLGPNRLTPTATIFSIGLPTGSPLQSTGSIDPSLSALWQQNFPRGYAFVEVAQVTLTTANGVRHPAWSPAIAVSRILSSRLGVFAEYAPHRLADGTFNYLVHAGVAYLHTPVLEIDTQVGYLAAADGAHVQAGICIARRFDYLHHAHLVAH